MAHSLMACHNGSSFGLTKIIAKDRARQGNAATIDAHLLGMTCPIFEPRPDTNEFS
jgi:hypothetical protein